MQFIAHPLLREGRVEARLYQELAVARVLEKGNTLVVAPTALGKTPIAIMVAAHVLHKQPGKKILFLAPTKPLVSQHAESFKQMTNVGEVAVFTGETPAGLRAKQWSEARAVFATPQTIEACIFAQQVDLSDVALLVFDEAHRAVGDYAYVFIADQYAHRRGLILGLTASPGGTREKIQEICRNLYIQHVEIKTEQDEDVTPYIKQKTWETAEVDLPEEMREVKSLLEGLLLESANKLRQSGFVPRGGWHNRRDLISLNSRLLREKNPASFQAISEVAAMLKLHYALELCESQGIEQLAEYFVKLSKEKTKAARRLGDNPKFIKASYLAKKHAASGLEHPKLAKLLDVLRDVRGQAIVFTNYRSSAKKVEDFLEKNGIRARQFIGQSAREGTRGMRQKEQLELIQQFRDGAFSVLVATAIGEEGLDIPVVDAVVFYEPVASEIRKIQRAGRTGRHSEGRVVFLITRGTRDEAYFYVSKAREKTMTRVLSTMEKGELLDPPRESQKTLAEFATGGRPVIYADQRERSSGVLKELQTMDIIVKPLQLPVGDFLVSDRCVVERKSAHDFVSSMIDGRLFDQAGALKRNFRNPLFVIEGAADLYDVRNVHANAIRGALGSIAVDYGIPIIPTRDVRDTAEFLAVLAKREQTEKERLVRLQGEKRSLTDRDQAVFIIESLPGVGPALARDLLKHFKSVERVFSAGEKELREVGNIGEKKAKEIRRVVSKEFGKED
jgi:Fanconi anemia group M protein